MVSSTLLKNTKALPYTICVAAMLLCFLLSGCCSKSASKAPSEKVTLEFWNTMEGAEAEIIPEILSDFAEANPGIEINETRVDFYKAKEKFMLAAQSGSAPDIMRSDRFWLYDFVNNGLITDLPERQIAEELEDMVPVARSIVTFNDRIWALPVSVDSLALFYNKKHFAEKNLKVPVNFDDFAAAAAALTDSNTGRYGFFIYPNGWYFEPFAFGFGGQYFDPEGNLTINSDATRKGLEFLLHLKDRLKAVPPVNLRSNVYPTMMHSFGSGQVSMIFSGPWAIRTVIAGSAFKDDNSNLGIAPLPEGPHGTFSPTGCQALVISKESKHKEAAVKFIKYMYSTDVQMRLSMINFGLPVRRAVFAMPELKRDPYLQTFIKQMQMSRRIINSPRRGEIYAPLGDKLKQVLNGETTPDYALNDFVAEWNRHR